ncbi:RagB/SusD family nutrient uptake outer membrane protein [Chitinophaga horti]|uniref:RagB/SusD family nutrient uptake outer membrane protein n=1 Tax=Chitinophaga horti TaxID=2920382 RepID=A0ABY6IV08_9BACT|nr:RagB/SusD family nutrient uptake outer membrane protein [Chitinophaga horti]UYQ91212.1 RagB/SusD family nutrient uptake outer membrane protein [Chitinophaga horti]
MKRNRYILALLLTTIGFTACNKYLDVVPEGTASLDDVWKSEQQCQQFVNTLYSQIPPTFYHTFTPDWLAGDDMITSPKGTTRWYPYKSLLYGEETPNNSYFQLMGSKAGTTGSTSHAIYRTIRYCHLLLENVSKVPSLSQQNSNYWKGEALFLIAYYHHLLLQYYGPIVLEKSNISLNAPEEQMYVPRSTYDECVDYIATKYDEAAVLLPPTRPTNELGYATGVMAKAYKSRLLLMAASPQYNGNAADYAEFKNKNGKALMNLTYDPDKWVRARDAAQDAIEMAEANGYRLYTNPSGTAISMFDQGERNYHDAFCEPAFNTDEFIHALGNPTVIQTIQHTGGPRVVLPYNTASFRGNYVPTMEAVEMYYSKNGLPMDVDPETRTLDLYAVAPGDSTVRLHRNREPRFYASVGFDRGKMAFNNDTLILRCRAGELQGDLNNDNAEYQSASGYVLKKFMHKSVYWNNTTKAITFKTMVLPYLRLAELYLNYAEADFEASGTLSQTSLNHLNKIRTRSGLPNFEASWALAGGIPTGDALRKVMHQERSVELLMEGRRYHDLRRWKEANVVMNKKPQSWNLKGRTMADFYKRVPMQESGTRIFEHPKTVWLAIPIDELNVNYNLVKNPGY